MSSGIAHDPMTTPQPDAVEASNRFQSGRHLVYTVIAGDYDSLKRPLWRSQNVDYVAFVSEPQCSDARGWRLLPVPNLFSDPKLINREMKILGIDIVEEYDSIIYVDGSIQIIGSLERLVNGFLESGDALGLFRHCDRVSPWEELAACKKLGYLSEEEHGIEKARLQLLEDDGAELGLFDAGVILKNPRQEALPEISERWFQLFFYNPVRDQLSLPIVVWEHEQAVSQLEHWNKSYTPTFLRYPHKVAGPVTKSLFWLGSAFPRLFQMAVVFSRRQRQWLAESIAVD